MKDKLNNYYNKLDDLAKRTIDPEDRGITEDSVARAERMMDEQDEEPNSRTGE